MREEALARLLQLTMVLGSLIMGLGAVRLQWFHNFVDQRKNALRTQLREQITACPELLSVVQNIGKEKGLEGEECEVFRFWGDGYVNFIREIYHIRRRYDALISHLLLGFSLWAIFCSSLILGVAGTDWRRVLLPTISVCAVAIFTVTALIRPLRLKHFTYSEKPMIRSAVSIVRDQQTAGNKEARPSNRG